jgi:hypothetical protein
VQTTFPGRAGNESRDETTRKPAAEDGHATLASKNGLTIAVCRGMLGRS